ncbi:hypothetical protein B566_EDAN011783 [Ephemera danica]|nr:hypothetical protein B566_EDAN011783 [Ephemera danica]
MSKCTAVGIDLGTSFSAVAVYDVVTKQARLLADDKGRVTTPSVVAFKNDGDGHTGRMVGYKALDQIGYNPENTITEVKRIMGRKFEEYCVQEDISRWPFEVVDKNGEPRIKVINGNETRLLRPEQISAMILMHLKNIACEHLDLKPFDNLDAVLTVPVNFGDSQRLATREACQIAGINVLKFITEPASAAIAYGIDESTLNDGSKILVFDMGGGTTDVSVLTMGADHQYEVMACVGDSRLGGEDLDTVLAMCEDILQRAVGLVRSCLEQAQITRSDLTQVVLAGGSSKIPRLQAIIAETLPNIPIHTSHVQDEIVASGAAYQAAKDKGFLKLNLMLTERIPWSLGINDKDGFTVKVMERNAKIPGEKTETFRTAFDHQTAMLFKIYEGENRRSEKNRLLGSMTLNNIRVAARGMVAADTTFKVDANGILKVTAVEQNTTNSISVNIARYKGEMSAEKMQIIHQKSKNENALSLMRGLVKNLQQLAIKVQQSDELTEAQKTEVSAEADRVKLWFQGKAGITDVEFTDVLEDVRKQLAFCCLISNTGVVTFDVGS